MHHELLRHGLLDRGGRGFFHVDGFRSSFGWSYWRIAEGQTHGTPEITATTLDDKWWQYRVISIPRPDAEEMGAEGRQQGMFR
jgi:hypothetical protein